MNNSQKIVPAVFLLAACLGLTACEQNDPNKGTCISNPEQYAEKCGPNAPKKDKRYCLGGEDFICTKPSPKVHNRVPAKLSPVETPFTPTSSPSPSPTPAVPTSPAVSEVPAGTFPVPVDTIPMPVETASAPVETEPAPGAYVEEASPIPFDANPEPEETVPMPVEMIPATSAPYRIEVPTSR